MESRKTAGLASAERFRSFGFRVSGIFVSNGSKICEGANRSHNLLTVARQERMLTVVDRQIAEGCGAGFHRKDSWLSWVA